MRNRLTNKGLLPFEEFMSGLNWDYPAVPARRAFKVDVKENEKGYVVHADLPGCRKEDITVEYKNKNLVITASKEESHDEERENYILHERSSGQIYRSFYIENINEENVTVEFKDGVLTINLPKRIDEETGGRRFEVK